MAKNILNIWKFIKESLYLEEGNFYIFNNKIILIKNIIPWSDEYKIIFEWENGDEDFYIGNRKDIKEDFKETNFKFKKQREKINTKSKNKNEEVEVKYNLVYYIGNKKVETIKRNLPLKLAYKLKNKISKYSQYKMGKIKLEKVI